MAEVIHTGELPLVHSLAGASVIGIDSNGDDARFPLANIVRNNIGQMRTTDPAPSSPLLNQSVDLIGTGPGQSPAGVYAGLVKQGGGALVIPTPAPGNAIINAKAVWSGSFWVPVYQEVTYRILQPGVTLYGNYADNYGQGLVVEQADATVSFNKFARNGGVASAANSRPLCALYAKGMGLTITSNHFADSGVTGGSTAAANDIYLMGNNCIVQGNQFTRAKGVSVVVRGSRNLCDNLVYSTGMAGYTIQGNRNTIRGLIANCTGGGVDVLSGNDNVIDIAAEGNSTFDVRIAAGCLRTVVYQKPGMVIINNGTGTVIK